MSDLSWVETVHVIHTRARGRCEYCQTQQAIIGQAMHVEHILPSGGDGLDNLCLACPSCSLSKATATSAIDPETGLSVGLFNPRQQTWHEHFVWVDKGQRLEGQTPVGRATVERLSMNRDRILVARALWVRAGLHPPPD